MSYNSWQQVLITQQADGTALTASTTPTSILNPAARFTLPANLLLIGTKLHVKASGRVSTVTTPGTLTLDMRFGATAVIFNGGAITLNATAQTNASWVFDADLIVRSIGASTSATILGTATWSSRALVGSAASGTGYGGSAILPDTAPVVGTGFDSTIANTVDFFATWGTSNANSILTHQYELTLCN